MPSAKSKKNMTNSGGGNRKKNKNKSKAKNAKKEEAVNGAGDAANAKKLITDDKINNNILAKGDFKGEVKISVQTEPVNIEPDKKQEAEVAPDIPKLAEKKTDVAKLAKNKALVATNIPKVAEKRTDIVGVPNGAKKNGKMDVPKLAPQLPAKDQMKIPPEKPSILSPEAKPFVMKRTSSVPTNIPGPIFSRPTVISRSEPLPEGFALKNKESKVIEKSEISKNFKAKFETPFKVIKHPLLHSWTLWYYKNDTKGSWEQNQCQVMTVRYIEDFWSLYHHVLTPSEMRSGTDYSLFKENIKPMWEDPRNKEGGRWVINFEKRDGKEMLNMNWLEMMLFLIGANVDDDIEKYINGAVLNVRHKGNKLALWLDQADISTCSKIGEILKNRVLKLPPNLYMYFEFHEDNMRKTGSTSKFALRI